MDFSVDEDSSNESEADAAPRCLTDFSSVAAVGQLLMAEETRDLSSLLNEFASSSDDDEKQRGGSRPGRSANIQRDFEGTHERLIAFCFNGEAFLYTEAQFKRRFRVSSTIFQRIYDGLFGKGVFCARIDATKKKGIHPLVRMTAVFRTLAHGTPADCQDEVWQIGESTVLAATKNFCCLMATVFGDQCLNRTPTKNERDHMLAKSACRGFPGCFASWACKRFVLDKCPVALQGQHEGHSDGGKCTKTLEAIADDQCHFWHINFGDPGSLNDINALDKSSIVGALISGQLDLKTEPHCVNGTERDWMCFFADGIYPEWAIFVKTIPHAAQRNQNDKRRSKKQEAMRKDIERAFGMLAKKFHALARPIRLWNEVDIRNMICACVMLHNMMVEERINELGDGAGSLSEEDHARRCEEDPSNETINPNSVFSRLPSVTSSAENDLVWHTNERFARANNLHYLLTDRGLHNESVMNPSLESLASV